MIRLIQFLIFGHIHKWETESVDPLTTSFGSRGDRYILKCKNCGNVKKVDLVQMIFILQFLGWGFQNQFGE